MKRILIAVVSIIFLLVFLSTVRAQSLQDEKITSAEDHVPGELLVDLRDDVSQSEILNFEKKYRLSLTPTSFYSEVDHLLRLRVPEREMEGYMARLRSVPEVEAVEPNYIYQAFSIAPVPNDPLYKYQWHMEKINVRRAWPYTTGENVIVAVIDTGVAFENYKNFHRVEDLEKTKFVPGYNFIHQNNHPNDDHAHGTHVAGTIAQSTYNHKGVAGVAFGCRIMPLKVLNSQGFGSVAGIAQAMKFAADKGAKVINMSLGGPRSSAIMEQACRYAYRKGVLIVCAAGNSSSERISYPAAYPWCIAVSATRFDDKLTFYTNRGKDIDLAAPGGDLNVDQNGDGYKDGVLQNTILVRDPTKEDYLLFQGTSMASPHVAGTAALIESLGMTNPRMAEFVLKVTARRSGLGDLLQGYGAGIVDAGKAVYYAGFLDGCLKMLLGFALSFFALRYLIRVDLSLMKQPLFLLGLVFGSSGFFFLPALGIGDLPLRHLLTSWFPQWDIPLMGAENHQNPLFYSALFPIIAAVLCCGCRNLRQMICGFCLGVGAHLAHSLLLGPGTLKIIPEAFFLDKMWLAANVLVCIALSGSMINAEKGEEQ